MFFYGLLLSLLCFSILSTIFRLLINAKVTLYVTKSDNSMQEAGFLINSVGFSCVKTRQEGTLKTFQNSFLSKVADVRSMLSLLLFVDTWPELFTFNVLYHNTNGGKLSHNWIKSRVAQVTFKLPCCITIG